MSSTIYQGVREYNGKQIYFDENGMYVDEYGNPINPKRFIRDFTYKVIPDTIKEVNNGTNKNVNQSA